MRLKSQIRATLNAVQLTREYQGLVLDTAGTGTLLLNVFEHLGDFRVVRVDVNKDATPGQTFRMDIESMSQWSVLIGFNIKLSEGRWNVDGVFLLERDPAFVSLLKAAFFALLVSVLLSWMASKSKEQERIRNAESKALLVTQIAHDIRSPLAALKAVSRNDADLSFEDQSLMEAAIQRINAIAENLLRMSREATVKNAEVKEAVSVLAIQDLNQKIELLKREKSLEYSNTGPVEIILNLDLPQVIARVKIDPAGFMRVLSNLINNSIEASLPGNRRIIVSTRVELFARKWFLIVEDHGTGFPEHLIAKLGRHGLTYGKVGGNGIGIAHAIQQIKSWGGTFAVESLRNPTRICITLPCFGDDPR